MVNPWRDDSQPQSSGLFGPVRIESHDYELLKFSPLSVIINALFIITYHFPG